MLGQFINKRHTQSAYVAGVGFEYLDIRISVSKGYILNHKLSSLFYIPIY